MAWELPVLDIPGQIAGADFSGATGTTAGYQSTGQFLFVKMSATNDTHVPCASQFDRPSGISQNTPTSGAALAVRALGVSKVMVGAGGVTAGDVVGPDANGCAVTIHEALTGGTLGQHIAAQVLEGGAQGTLATVLVLPAQRVQ